MLAGLAKLPRFSAKVEQAKQLIRESLAIAPAYVACSWGKDSIVLTHLAQQVQSNIPVFSFYHPERDLISNYSEVEKLYCEKFGPNLTTIGVEGGVSSSSVQVKVRAAKLWLSFPMALIGLRKEESSKRKISLCKYGKIHRYKSSGWRSCPLADWVENDIWAYIVGMDLPYLSAYDMGATRTTDHISKAIRHQYQATRLEEFRKTAPEYYQFLQETYPEIFHATN